MQFRQDDTYRAECREGVSFSSIQILSHLYQPLIGSDGMALYLTLTSEAAGSYSAEKLRRLLSLTGLPIDGFGRTVARLEEYGLLKTWCRESGDHVSYIFEMNRILTAGEFFGRPRFMSAYLAAAGKEEMEAMLARFGASTLSRAGYYEITRPVSEEPVRAEQSVQFTEEAINPVLMRGDSLWPLFSSFISKTSTLVFPAELRTPEHLNLICHLGAVNGLSAATMREVVARCVDMKNVTLDTEKMKVLAARARPEQMQSEDPYMLPPALFLEQKQNGVPVTGSDRSILQYLAADLHFPAEVINVMVEYVLNISSNRLNRKFVESVAGEWAREGIRTREQALEQTKKAQKKNTRSHSRITVDTPGYFKKQKEGKIPEEHSADPALIAKIQEMQKKMGG